MINCSQCSGKVDSSESYGVFGDEIKPLCSVCYTKYEESVYKVLMTQAKRRFRYLKDKLKKAQP